MHYAHYQDITQPYDLVCLSPHLDDAALSCAGELLAARHAGLRTLVITVCTSIPPVSATYSALAVEFHREWGLDEAQAVTTRLGEDGRAMAILGVDDVWLNLDDAIYRMPGHYNSRETLFAMPHASDTLADQLSHILRELMPVLGQARWLIPARVGMHVDHLNVFAAAQAVLTPATISLYEEVPYALTPEWITQRQQMFNSTIDLVPMGPYIAAKIAAIHCYASQMDALFGDGTTMPAQITEYHRHLGHGTPVERRYRLIH
ncbi:MAG: GlcNAc-PI de-N-acetylase [Chloroflexi bacterium]|nr:GlcNAc-PI de-N-acetylase [Chloroflexota bacterium]